MEYIAVITDDKKYWKEWLEDYLISVKSYGHVVVVRDAKRIVNQTSLIEYFYVNGRDNDLTDLRGRFVDGAVELCELSTYQRMVLNTYLNRNK